MEKAMEKTIEKESYLEYLDSLRKELDSRVKILAGKAEEISDDSQDKRDLLEKMDAIEVLQKDFSRAVEDLKDVAEQEFADAKARTDRLSEQFKDAVNKAINKHTIFEPVG